MGGHPRHAPSYGLFRLYRPPGGGLSVALSAFGGFIVLASGVLFFTVLIRGQRAQAVTPEPYRFATAIYPPVTVPAALNGFGLWVALMIGLTVTNYSYTIVQLALRPGGAVPAIYIGEQR